MNDDNIQSMNIAREQQALIKQKSWSEITTTFSLDNTTNSYIQNTNESNYVIEISVNIDPLDIDSYYDLHHVHIEVSKDGKTLCETYTYYESR